MNRSGSRSWKSLSGCALVVLVLAATTQPVAAQTGGVDPESAMHYSLYYENFKNENYTDALPDLHWILDNAPGFSIAYRLGFYYDQTYVSPVAGTDINTIALTGGFSLPALLAGTRLDINFEVGTRGTTDGNLVHDRLYGVSATLNIGERWFVKRKLR